MNSLRPTIESMLEMDLETLEKMSDAEIAKYLEESLTVQPIIAATEFVVDEEAVDKVYLKSSSHRKKPKVKQSPTDFTPKTAMGKQLAKLEQLQTLLTSMAKPKN